MSKQTGEFFHLKSEYFPPSTKDLFSLDEILQYGVLPLGFKSSTHWFRRSRNLNLGFLDPRRSQEVRQVEGLARNKVGQEFDQMVVYAILPAEFVEVLEGVYGVAIQEIRARSSKPISPILEKHLCDNLINPS